MSGYAWSRAVLLVGLLTSASWAQAPVGEPAGTAVVAPSGPGAPTASETTAPLVPPQVQLVTFHVPDGVRVEVLGPSPVPVSLPAGPGAGKLLGLMVGVGYRLKVTGLPDRPGAVLYPVLEVVGHLHRPKGIDPAKFPIRVPFGPDDFDEAVAQGRLVTKVVYLEDPDQALPLNLPKDEIPMATLSPAEDPLRVAASLGRPMVIVRIGNRMPTPEEITGAPLYDMAGGACPFAGPDSGRCPVPCGPGRGSPPPSGRAWLPKDEFLCDGGDRGEPLHFGGEGSLRGIDPRDAVIAFQDINRPRVLPTNMVCLYAPRFAGVRTSVGPNQNTTVDVLKGAEMLERQVIHEIQQGPRRLTQNQTAELSRHRMRPSGMAGRVYPGSHIELRILAEADVVTQIGGLGRVQGPATAANREKAALMRVRQKAEAFKTAESAVVTGIVEGAGEQAMAWRPQEMAGVEVPPGKLGLAVVKRVSADQAEPGDIVTFVIQYRNMGNVPINAVSVIDSLMPRLEYVPRSAKGPAGSVFSATLNRTGSLELRWDIGTVAPGAEGLVSFDAKVR
jgi:uncharacterized repeat protein (TIGR01451 family)